MSEEYKRLIRLAIYLFEESDAEVIEFGDPPLKITRKTYYKITGVSPQNPNIQIINNLSSNINIENKTIIKNIVKQLDNEGKERKELKEVRKKLNDLSNEVQKDSPNWGKIKKIIFWALDYGKDFFIQLIPILLRMNP